MMNIAASTNSCGKISANAKPFHWQCRSTRSRQAPEGEAVPFRFAGEGLIHVQQLSYRFGDQYLWQDIDLHVNSGEKVAIIGPSGSGKTTFLRVLAGLLPRQQGQVILGDDFPLNDNDQAISDFRNHHLGMVFQEDCLIGALTVAENLHLRLAIAQQPEAAVSTVLARLGLTDFADATVKKLSGGQRQRLSAARALITQPEIVLADEPTGNLDDASAEAVLDLLLDDPNRTVLIATHDRRVINRCQRQVRLAKPESAA